MKLFLILSVLVAGAAYFGMQQLRQLKNPADLFLYPETTIWGASKEDASIKPFSVKIDSKDIADLKRRLNEWRRHDPLVGIGSSYGFAGERLDKLVKYWREKYNFTKFETKLNALPQFSTVIQGLNVHFLHVKGDPKATKRVPLLLLHGWPGSVVEFYHLIPLLTSVGNNGVAFDIVAPSLPGFGFSEAPSKPFSPLASAQVIHALMKRLNYEKYVVQCGSWGALVGALIVRIYPQSVIGFHTNYMPLPTNSHWVKAQVAAALIAPQLFLTKEETAKLTKWGIQTILEETGYFHEQATKPDTLGVALSDSPVGLLAWIAEKVETESEQAELKGDKGGISNDDFLTNVMVYWFTNHVTSASRIFKEFIQNAQLLNDWQCTPITVPSAVTCYPFDLPCSPKPFLEHTMPNLVRYVDAEHGGHFAALEEPQLFANDFRAAVAAFFDKPKH